MVVRRQKKNRKFLGTRRWGVGNIKNRRGAGGRGGVGELARLRKHDWTYYTAKAPELIKLKGFSPWRPKRLKQISLGQINTMVKRSAEQKTTLEFKGYKVLSNGQLEKPATIMADRFSKNAIEKIKGIGGNAVVIKGRDAPTTKAQSQPAQQPAKE